MAALGKFRNRRSGRKPDVGGAFDFVRRSMFTQRRGDRPRARNYVVLLTGRLTHKPICFHQLFFSYDSDHNHLKQRPLAEVFPPIQTFHQVFKGIRLTPELPLSSPFRVIDQNTVFREFLFRSFN